ncbi:MAG TPA: 3-ketoacyl-ACP reductase [Chitinivibrionales bacterium]|jgi:NAD(P)-dependent dehydrogenase (short-subunit alcohol dehydrogenase family)|nr:3-ketoacyl-ACP reductase [Chitinivibrionales bacterium]
MKKKTVLITGAGRGIGFAIAQQFAKEGYDVAVFDVLPQDDVAKNMAALKAAGAKVLYWMGDVSSALDRSNTLDAIRKTMGGLNVLVNNAGVAPKVRADVLDATEESWERVMRINLQGPYFLTQLAARWMIEQKKADKSWSGCIINISSTSAETASISRGEYCVSKAGVSMATKLWAVRLAQEDIPVYEIRPGIIMTDMTSVVKEKYDKLIAEGVLLQKRWGMPEDIAKCAAMMARGDIGYSTGQVVNVDGGFNISRL